MNSNDEVSQSQLQQYHQQQPQHYHTPYQQQHHIQQSVATGTSGDKDWVPSERDLEQLNKWFYHLDTAGVGYIGGAQAVGFLSNSNLSRDTLRIIWGLVDAASVGYIDLHQFYKTIRLVAISSSPMFAGSPPTMESYYATVGMNINLPLMGSAEQERVVPSVVNKAPSPVGVPTDYVDITDTQQHVSHPGHQPQGTTAPIPTSSLMTSHNVMPIHMMESVAPIDDVLDIKMVADPIISDDFEFEFSDFESASPATNQSTVVPPQRNIPEILRPAVPHDDYDGRGHALTDEADFGDFSAPSPPPRPSVPAPVYIPTLPVPATIQLREGSTPPLTMGVSIELGPALSVPSIVQNGDANARMSFFDDLIESDLQQGGEEWEDFAASNDNATANVASDEGEEVVNPFDAFISDGSTIDQDHPETAETAVDTSAKVQNIHSTPNSTSAAPSNAASNFGFESSFLPVPIEHSALRDSDLTPFTSGIFATPPSSAVPALSVVAVTPHGVPDVDSFMSFEDLAPADSGPLHSNKTEEVVMDEDFGDFEEADAFHSDTPSVVVQKPLSLPFTATFTPAPPSMNRTIPDTRFDTMDLLSMDDPPMTSSLITSPSTSSSFAMDNFAPIMGAAFHSSYSPSESAFDTRSGGTTAEIFSPSLSPPYTFFDTPQSKDKEKDKYKYDAKNGGSSSSRSDTVSPCESSISALEELVCTLVDKDYYEEAHCCLQKLTYLRTVDQLNKEKAEAIDSDDLETAVSIKKKLASMKTSSASLEDESKWTSAARSVRNGESIEDLVELVVAIDPKRKTWAEKLFNSLKTSTSSAPNMADKVSKALSVKRYLRMATAVSTTHSKHSQYWLLLLNHVSSAVQNTSNIMDAFNRLRSQDKECVLKCDKMRVFITGSLQIAELGVWVSASCIESMVHEVAAERVVAQCSVFLKAAEAIWSSKVKPNHNVFEVFSPS